ncbi:MAG: ATP F0F1 synthase subunit alpha [Mycoplasmataceae bacterium]|nr:ATP F0F1 synthase subunit alpha [Mycoplasmataceae bacterium]
MAKITQIKDNIITIAGESNYKEGNIYKLAEGVTGMLVSATKNQAKLLASGDPSLIKLNSIPTLLKEDNQIPVYEHYFGRIISPSGESIHPIDLKVPVKPKLIGKSPMINNSPSIMDRVELNEPMETGIIAIDTMIPIGKGQRELIIGDRTTGKTSIVMSTIINQKDKNVKVIYVSVGQKRNSVISLYNTLKEHDVLNNTIVVFANPDCSAQQFTVPNIGMAMAEAIAYKGQDVLVIFDDLTKHANVYREISLSIGRNPGREAYPTDIFYQHSSLLERAGKFSKKYNGGSITALPIVETVQGDLASLIPSNVISITDGQIFTSSEMFNKGIYPSINIQLSVSRTGGSVQSNILRNASQGLKADHATLSEIKKFADISIDMTDELNEKIKSWDGMNNLLVQYGYVGYSREMIVVLIRMLRMNELDKISNASDFSVALHKFANKDKAAKIILKNIKKNKMSIKEIDDQIKAIFAPLAKAASGVYGDLFSSKEFEKLKGGK